MRRCLPFFLRESNAIIKIYPRRIVFELPNIDVKATELKVMELDGRIFVVGHLEGKVGSALAKDENRVIHVGDVEGPNTRNGTTCDYTACGCPREGIRGPRELE